MLLFGWNFHHWQVVKIFTTASCQNDNFQCSQGWKFRQNDDISVSVSENLPSLQFHLHPYCPRRQMDYCPRTQSVRSASRVFSSAGCDPEVGRPSRVQGCWASLPPATYACLEMLVMPLRMQVRCWCPPDHCCHPPHHVHRRYTYGRDNILVCLFKFLTRAMQCSCTSWALVMNTFNIK